MNWQFLNKWLPRLAFFMFWPALLLVGWGELASAPAEAETHVWDKLLHFIAYFGLSGMIAVALRADRRVVTSTLLVVVIGGVLEILQGFTGRDPSFYDQCSNTLGAICGAGAGWGVARLTQPKMLAGSPRN